MITLVKERYSRVLIPLPPVESIKKKARHLVEDTFVVTPEYIETPWFEGYAIGWRSWYGFDNLRYPSMRSFFPLQLKRILDDWLGDEEEAQVIEWIDENKWEWLDVRDDYDELYRASYNLSPNKIVYAYTYLLSIVTESGSIYRRKKEIALGDWLELEKMKEAYPVFKVLARRGYWNIPGIIVGDRRKEFYEKIGFKFENGFQT